MPNLIDIRRRIKSTKNTQQITKAMKMVSASRLRRAQERAEGARPYAERLFAVHNSILQRLPDHRGELYRVDPDGGKTLLVVLAGDKGLCGSFNANILKAADRKIAKLGADRVDVVAVGKKAVGYFRKREDVTVLKGFPDVFRSVDVGLATEIAQCFERVFLDGEYGNVILLFNKFRSMLVQEPTETKVLPLAAEADQAEAEGMEHLAEPSLTEILDELAPSIVITSTLQALMESCAAEHAARMTAMDAATNNAKDLIEELTLEMNKARQAAITNELIEIVSGAAAL